MFLASAIFCMPVRAHVDLDAKNIILGTVRFVSISVPEGWRVFPLRMVEVETSKESGGITWATNGHITVGVISDDGGEVLLKVSASEPVIRRGFDPWRWVEKMTRKSEDHGVMRVNGHDCGYVLRRVREGLFKRGLLWEVILCFFCDVTGRKLEIKILGRNKDEVLFLKDLLQELSCH